MVSSFRNSKYLSRRKIHCLMQCSRNHRYCKDREGNSRKLCSFQCQGCNLDLDFPHLLDRLWNRACQNGNLKRILSTKKLVSHWYLPEQVCMICSLESTQRTQMCYGSVRSFQGILRIYFVHIQRTLSSLPKLYLQIQLSCIHKFLIHYLIYILLGNS